MRDIPKSPRIIEIKRKRRRKMIKLSILLFLIFILLVIGLSYLSREKHIVINNIKVNGAHVLNQEDIIEIAKNEMTGKYLYLFSRNNTFIYPSNDIHKALLINFPRIKELSLGLNGLNELEINIEERKEEFLYCGDSIPEDKEKIGDNCYFLNDDGLIFDEAPYFSGDIYFKYYIPLEENTEPLGKEMLEKDRFHELSYFFNRIDKLGFKSVYFEMAKDGINYLYLEKRDNKNNPKIIFRNSDNLDILLENLTLAMKKDEFSGEIKQKYNILEYIDLKFKNKILYKFQ
jgi:hypothetical protein